MGWQFAAAEFIGGPIMIVLLVLVGGYVAQRRLVDEARQRCRRLVGGHDHAAMVGVSEERQAELEHTPWREKLTSKAAWSDAASYTMADITMLRKELVIGYVVAGFLAVLVPMHVVERRVPHRPRVLDQPRERRRRPVHRLHQLRLLDRQRARWPPRCGTAGSASGA